MTLTNMLQDFTQFAQEILSTGEGIFWSFRRPEIGSEKSYWTTKLENLRTQELGNEGFIITDWRGEKVFQYSFRNANNANNASDEGFWDSLPDMPLLEEDLAFHLTESPEIYQAKIQQIQKAQTAGEMWVMNLATQLQGSPKFQVSNSKQIPIINDQTLILALKAYYKLLKSGKSHCGGVIWTPELKCVSFSPEVFLYQEEPHVLKTFPIKGTGSRAYLETSEKEISELWMVTDLLRNDLGMVAEEVEVIRERFLTDEGDFYHAQCEIKARLKEAHLTWDQLKTLLPPGSMTGCPKHRVGQYIKKLESFDRGFYSGTFGIKSGDEMVLGLLIRTLFFEGDTWRYPVGAGITVESDPEREAEELLTKAQILKTFF